MVTHSSTSRPVQCLCMAERTGCPVFTDLWSYVHGHISDILYTIDNHEAILVLLLLPFIGTANLSR
jgi:hypothetical protein